MPEEIKIAVLCQHMGWTYQQYMSQPRWLIQTLEIKLNEEAHEANKPKS